MSGSSVAYHLRVNKYVDRRLFIEALEFVARYQAVRDMGYVSMGGWYLEDFRVMHQSLGIRRMLTFDREEWVVRRQMVNKPYGFVECEVAASGEILDSFDDIRKRLVGPSGNVIVWLDYTAPAERHKQLGELEQLAGVLMHGDVFRITLNASRSFFGTNEQYQIKRKAGKTDKATLHEWWQEKMADQLKDYLAEERNRPELLESETEFARTLLWAVKKAALKGLQSRPELIVEPLLAVHYSDGQGMVTFAGLILGADRRDEFRRQVHWEEWTHAPGQQWDELVELNVPYLSLRERQVIHGKMDGEMDTVYLAFFAYFLGFQLDGNLKTHEQLVRQYMTHHRRYPTFAPSDIL